MDKTAHELKDELHTAKQRYYQGEITLEALYAAADAYILALQRFKDATHAKLRIPSRASLVR